MKKTLAVALVALTGTLMAGSFTPDRATDTTIKTNAFNATYVTILAPYTNGVGITLQELLDHVLAGNTQYFHYGSFASGLVVRGGLDVDTITGGTATFYRISATNIDGISTLRTYTYQNTGTVSILAGTSSGSTITLATQSVGQIHTDMYLTNAAVFATETRVNSVNYDTGVVTLNKALVGSAAGTSASFWGSGTYTHVVPSGWFRCKIYVTGGGGSGGSDEDSTDGADGGGAGGTSIGWWSLAAGASYTVTVGAGGTSVTNNTNGISGGTSSFGALQTATGGNGGLGAEVLGAAVGGIGAGGQINIRGGAGQPAQNYTSGAAAALDGGNGGASFWGGGASGSYGATAQSETVKHGVCPGEGGGGGDDDRISGRGAGGIVVVEYY